MSYNKVATQPCTACNFNINGAQIYLHKNLLRDSCRSRVYPCKLGKKELYLRGFSTNVSQTSSFKNFGKFSAKYLCNYFFNKVAGLFYTVAFSATIGISASDDS